MKKLFLTTLLGLIGVSGFSQGITIGVSTGVNNTFVLDKGLKQDPRFVPQNTYKWSPIGVTFGLDLTNRFGLQLEAIKNTAGQVYEIVDVYENSVGKREMVMNYLSMPFMLRFMDNQLNKPANFNFMIGPQLSLLTSGYESIQYASSDLEIPEGGEVPEGAVYNEANGSYTVPDKPYTVLADQNGGEGKGKLNSTDLQLAMNFGVRVKLGAKMSLNADIRGLYSFTDIRSDEFVAMVQDGTADFNDMIGRRANLMLGAQLGLNYYIGF